MADEFYISPAHGSDAGAGTEGDPFETAQHAFDQTATTPNATIFHMGNSANHPQNAEWFWTNGLGSKWSYIRHCAIIPWDEGVNGVNYRTINGVSSPEWVVDQDTTDMWATSEAPAYCYMMGGRIECTTAAIGTTGSVECGAYCMVDGMVVVNSDNTYGIRTTSGGTIRNCAVVTNNGTNYPNTGIYGLVSRIENCLVDGCNVDAVGGSVNHVSGSTFMNYSRSSSVYHALPYMQYGTVNNNIFYGNWNGVSGNGRRGIELGVSTIHTCANNIFVNLQYGIDSNPAWDPSLMLLRNNAWFNVDTRLRKDASSASGMTALATIDMSDTTDVTLDADPFVDAANRDFRLTTVGQQLLVGRGHVMPINYGGELKQDGSSMSSPSMRTDIGLPLYPNAGLPFAGYRS